MSTTIDERVVQMAFDNSRFERNVSTSISTLDKLKNALKFDGASDGLRNLENFSSRIDMSGLSSAVENISDKFSAFGILGIKVLENLAQKAVETGEKIVKSLAIDQIEAGWNKYAEKTTAVQTIMSATEETWLRDATAAAQAAAMVEKGVDPQRAYECAAAYQEFAAGIKTADQAAKDLGLTVGEFNELMEINADYIGDNFAYTGSQMDYVNEQMEKLNWFTDETSYNFTDMASNIGKFTANNIPLSQATTAMEGIATWAAMSGQNAASASRAMYNLSQAIGVGSVKLMDWRSIENANMATSSFKKQVLESAVAMGTLQQQADGTYKTLKGTTVSVENFSQTLQEGWFSKDVLLDVLNNYGGFTDQLYKLSEASDLTATDILELVEAEKNGTLTQEMINNAAKEGTISAKDLREKVEELASAENDLGYKALKAAQEAKTFADAIDATKDAASTQWMNIFENIFGDYERARHVWTDFANFLYDSMVAPLETIRDLSEGLSAPLDKFGKDLRKQSEALDISSEKMLKYVKAMREGTVTEEYWNKQAAALGVSADELTSRVEKLATDVYGEFTDALFESSRELGINSDKMLSLVEAYKNGTLTEEEWAVAAAEAGVSVEKLRGNVERLAEIGDVSGLDRVISGLKGIAAYIYGHDEEGNLVGIVGKLVEGFQKVIQPIELTKEGLLDLIKRFQEFGESLTLSEDLQNRLSKAGEGLASILQFLANTMRNLWQETAGVREPLKYLFDGVSDLVLDIFGLASGMDTTGKKSSLLASICSWLGTRIYKLSSYIRDFGLEKFQQALTVTGNILKTVYNSLETIWRVSAPLRNSLLNVFEAVVSLVSNLFSFGEWMDTAGIKGEGLRKVCEFLANIINKVAEAIKGLDIDSLKQKFSGVKSVFDGLIEAFTWLVEKISNFSIGDAFGKIVDYIKQKFTELKEFLSGVDWGAVLRVGLTGGIGALLGGKIVKWFKSGSSIIETLADLKEKLSGILDGISGALKSFTLGVKVDAIKNCATAVLELAVALLILGFVDYENAMNGVLAIGAIMGGLLVAIKAVDGIDNAKMMSMATAMLAAAAAMLVMAVALAVLSGVVALFTLVAGMEGIEKGLAVLAGVLIGVIAALAVMSELSPKVIISAAALLVLSAALIVLAGAIALFTLVAGMEDIGKGVALFVGAMLVMIATLAVLSELSPKVLISAAAMLVVSASLIVLAGALAIFVAIAGNENAWTGVGLLIATLAALTIALIALGATGPVVLVGAAALLVAAVACLILAAAVGVTAAVLPLLSAGLAALGEGIESGVTSIGQGIDNFMASMSNVITNLGEAIGNLVRSVTQGIADGIKAFGDGIGGSIEAIGEGIGSAVDTVGSGVGGAISSLGKGVSDAISGIIASIGEGIGRGITSISDAIGTFGESLSSASFGIENLGTAVRSLSGISWTSTAIGIGELALALKKLKVDNLATYLNDASQAVVRTCTEMVNAITASGPAISTAASSFGLAFAQGITGATASIKTSVSGFGSSAVTAISAYDSNWVILGRNVSIGFANGIYDRIGEVTKAVSAMADAATTAIQISIDAHSPSRLTEKFGGYFTQGFANGIIDNSDAVTTASDSMVDKSIKVVEQARGLIAAILQDDFTPTITPVVDMTNVENASSMIGSAFSNGKIGLSGELGGAIANQLASNVGSEGQTINNNNSGDTLYITNNVYASEGMDTEELAEAVMSQMQAKMARRNVALGA